MGLENTSAEVTNEVGSQTPFAPASAESSKLNNPLWMAKLYVSNKKARLANGAAEEIEKGIRERLYYNLWRAKDTVQIANQVERYMDRPDFETVREIDPGYQKLVEEFAILIGMRLLDRNQHYDSKKHEIIRIRPMDPTFSPANYASRAQAYERQAKHFQAKTEKIASEHNTPQEKAQYALFAIKSTLREFFGREVKANPVKASRGTVQLFKEMNELDKQRGKYRVAIGTSSMTKTMSRLEALGSRLVLSVTPLPPTPLFLTQEPKDNINTQIGPYLAAQKAGLTKV